MSQLAGMYLRSGNVVNMCWRNRISNQECAPWLWEWLQATSAKADEVWDFIKAAHFQLHPIRCHQAHVLICKLVTYLLTQPSYFCLNFVVISFTSNQAALLLQQHKTFAWKSRHAKCRVFNKFENWTFWSFSQKSFREIGCRQAKVRLTRTLLQIIIVVGVDDWDAIWNFHQKFYIFLRKNAKKNSLMFDCWQDLVNKRQVKGCASEFRSTYEIIKDVGYYIK